MDCMELTVILPTYNERENIVLLLWLLHQHLDAADPPLAWEAIVVDDGSPDGTAAIVEALQQKANESGSSCLLGKNVKLVQRPGKLGLGSAYAAGVLKAQGTWVVLMDADFSHHPHHILQMLDKQALTGCDIVSGTRYAPGGGVGGWGAVRKCISRGANLLAATLLGAKVSDLTGAFRLYRRDILQKLLSETTCRGYAFQMEVAVRAQYHGYRIEEVPIVFVDRLYGTSKLGPSEFLGFLRGLAVLMLTL